MPNQSWHQGCFSALENEFSGTGATPQSGSLSGFFDFQMSRTNRVEQVQTDTGRIYSNVLVIEDDDSRTDQLATLLGWLGVTVLRAVDANEALEIWSLNPFSIDLVVTDIILAGMTGCEVAVKLRKTRPDLKIIFTSKNNPGALDETSKIVKGAKLLKEPVTALTLFNAIWAELGLKPKAAVAAQN